MKTFYASIKNNLIFKKIKYEIGKIYQLNKKEIFEEWNDIDINEIYCELSIYLVKVDEQNNFFKILKEISYSEFLKNEETKEIFMSALKNRDEWSLSKFSDTSNISQKINIYIKNEDYINNLIKLNQLKDLSPLLIKYLHDKYLDYLIDQGDGPYDNDNISRIANLGIPKYLNIILQKNKVENVFEIRSVLENGRKKDIDIYIHDDMYSDAIITTGIDEYLDKLITNKKDDINISYSISIIGRKKDLDILVKSKSHIIRSTVAYHGYDEHLDMLINDESEDVLQSVLDIGRKKDIKILSKLPMAYEI